MVFEFEGIVRQVLDLFMNYPYDDRPTRLDTMVKKIWAFIRVIGTKVYDFRTSGSNT